MVGGWPGGIGGWKSLNIPLKAQWTGTVCGFPVSGKWLECFFFLPLPHPFLLDVVGSSGGMWSGRRARARCGVTVGFQQESGLRSPLSVVVACTVGVAVEGPWVEVPACSLPRRWACPLSLQPGPSRPDGDAISAQ